MRFIPCLLLLLSSCGPTTSAPDADATSDGGWRADASRSLDGGDPVDAGAMEDAGAGADAGVDAVGELTGSCGVLSASDLASSQPRIFESVLGFPTGFDEDRDAERLSPGAREILRDGTAGGSSVLSEAFAFDLLARCEGAELVKSETEIVYDDPMGIKTDMLVTLAGTAVGVSVTRAIAFPFDDPYTVEQASALLEDKLSDIAASSANVSAADAWEKQILVFVAYGPMHGASLRSAWDALGSEVRGDTVVWIVVTEGDDAFLY